MPNVEELSQNQALELSGDGLAAIRPRVKMRAKMRGYTGTNPDGSYNFGTGGFIDQDLELTDFVMNQHVVVKSQIPILPTNGGASDNQGDVTIQIDNTVKYIGAVQNEGILDADSIQDAEVTITATCGVMDELPIYKGRVVKAPREEEGKTTFGTKSIIWEVIDVEVKHEIATGGDIQPSFFSDFSGMLTRAPYTVPGKKLTFEHGVTVFDETGAVRSSVTNSKATEIALLRVEFQEYEGENPPIGKYTIKFTSSTNFTVTMPNNQRFTGELRREFSQGWLKINAGWWDIIGDPKDAEIEFFCSYVAIGNPITIVKNLIDKAFSDNWGNDPTFPSSQAVDWGRFDEFEQYFHGTTVYVTETNKDNSVFDPFNDQKPLRVRDFCQRILDHIGCQLTFDGQGRISMSCAWHLLPTEKIPTYQTAHISAGDTRKAAHSIDSLGQKYNRMVCKYGLNILTDDFAGTTTFVIAGATKFNTFRVSFPYFKTSKNDRDINALNNTLWEIVKTSNQVLKMKLKPNWGLPVAPGDKFEVSLSTQPILPNTMTGSGRYWQIYKVSKRIGGLVDVEAHMVPSPSVPLRLCSWILCQDALC